MQLANLKNALSAVAQKETSELELNPSFTLTINAVNTANRSFMRTQTEFARKNPKHQIVIDNAGFNDDFNARNITPAIAEYLAHVVITGWSLLDDNGKPQKFTPKECIDLLSLPDGIGAAIGAKVIDQSLSATAYEVDWESVVTKNS